MVDTFDGMHVGLESPAERGFAITPGSDDLAAVTRGIYVGETGDITVEMPKLRHDDVSGDVVTFTNLAQGVIHPIRAAKVTSATATGLVGVY